MATAVREMLAAASLPIDLEQTALLEKTLKLQEILDSESAKLVKTQKVRILVKTMLSLLPLNALSGYAAFMRDVAKI